MQLKAVLRGLGALITAMLVAAPLYWAAAATTRVDLGSGVGLELVEISPGTFIQGSPPSEAGRKPDEGAREVHLTKPFSIGRFPVTRGQYARFAAETGYRTEAEKGNSGGFGWTGQALMQRKEFNWRNPGFPQTDEHPITLVTYNDARAFIDWLNRKSGGGFRLPTEAEWEYVCKAGSISAPAKIEAWSKANSDNATHPVGQLPANAWGVSDMLGNVWEWCSDWFAPYQPGPVTDPEQTNSALSDKPRRVLRGGSWLRDPADCRPAARYRNDPQSRNADNGFRVVRVASAAAAPAAAAARVTSPKPSTPTPEPVNLEADPAQPARKPAPPVAAEYITNPRSGTGLGTFACFGLTIGGLWVLVRSIFRRGGGGGGSFGASAGSATPSGRPVYTRVVQDGFWIQGDAIARGASLLCRYTAGGNTQETELAYEPGPEGHFVFTGETPTHVSVVMNDTSSTTRSTAGNWSSTRRTVQPPPVSRRFSGHPPAY